MDKMRLTIIALVISIFPSDVAAPRLDTGTSIVCVRVPDRIWVGADSLVARRSLDEKLANDYMCKIFHHDNLYFAFTSLLDVSGYYDAKKTASEVAK
jgi:hypothetical protein